MGEEVQGSEGGRERNFKLSYHKIEERKESCYDLMIY